MNKEKLIVKSILSLCDLDPYKGPKIRTRLVGLKSGHTIIVDSVSDSLEESIETTLEHLRTVRIK